VEKNVITRTVDGRNMGFQTRIFSGSY